MTCKFCGPERHAIREAFDDGFATIIDADGMWALSVSDNGGISLIYNIYFCPMCGRSLVGDAK